MKVRPLSNRVLVRPEKKADTTKGGIILPDMAQEKPQRGKIIAKGPGKIDDHGRLNEMDVAIGDLILFARYAGSTAKELGDDILMSEDDILAVIEE